MSVVTLRSRRGEQEARRQPALEHPGHGSRGVMGRPQGPGRRLGPSVDARRQAVAFGAALRIAEKWGLTQQQLGVLLGGISRSTISRWSAQWRGNKRIAAFKNLLPDHLVFVPDENHADLHAWTYGIPGHLSKLIEVALDQASERGGRILVGRKQLEVAFLSPKYYGFREKVQDLRHFEVTGSTSKLDLHCPLVAPPWEQVVSGDNGKSPNYASSGEASSLSGEEATRLSF